MYLDHHAVQRIAHILEQIDNPALLMDDGGNVLYPEGDQRHLTLPEAVRNDPSRPLIYGGVTLIGIRPEHLPGEEGRLYLCLTGDSGDVRNCAVLASELIGMILKVDIGATDRSQALRLILRGENDAAEMESLAAAHGFEMDGERCVVCLYSRTLTCDQISQQLSEVLDAERDMFTDMSRHSVAVVRQLPRESSFEDLQKLPADLENAFAEADMDVLIGVSDPRENLTHQRGQSFSGGRAGVSVSQASAGTLSGHHSQRSRSRLRRANLQRADGAAVQRGDGAHHRGVFQKQPEPFRSRPEAVYSQKHAGLPAGKGAAAHGI